MLTLNLKFITQNPFIRKLVYSTGIRKPRVPHVVGMSYYQENSSWGLHPEICSCDVEFVEYLKESQIEGKSIFHFGTGTHHIIALENQKLNRPNEIIGITASVPEHDAYVKLVLKDQTLAKYYKVLFADIYTLTDQTLPQLDIADLFHLCEFYTPANAPFIHQNDQSLVQLFIDKLNPDGKLFFYSRSFAWDSAKSIVKSFEEAGKIKLIGEYKNLVIYAKAS